MSSGLVNSIGELSSAAREAPLIDTPAPYDAETIDRIGEVLEHLRDA